MRIVPWPKQLRKPKIPPRHRWDLSASLLQWDNGAPWSVRESIEGLLCLGRSGGGKTSGPGEHVAISMLNAGYGGLVLCAKADEANLWRKYCSIANRLDDLVVISPDSPWRFNPFAHQLSSRGNGTKHVENVVHLLTTILEIADRDGGHGDKGGSEPYWRQACRQLMRNLVGLLILATGTVTITDLYRAIMSTPRSPEEVSSPVWQKSSDCYRLLRLADERPKSAIEQHDFRLIADYILVELAGLASRTRSVITSTFTAMIDVMQRGELHSLFGRDTTITPEVIAEEGKIIVIDYAVKTHGQIGIIANVLFKHCFQRSIERRAAAQNQRPVFLFADEAHYFVTSHDALFGTTCRSAKVAMVLLSQSVSNFYAALGGGDKGRAEADALFANLNTKVFCCNGDFVTNEFAANQIGRSRQFFHNSSQSSSGDDWFGTVTGLGQQGQSNAGLSEQTEFDVPPQLFTTLRTGGPANGGVIEAIVFQSGRRFTSTGRTWIPVQFKQKLN